MRVENLIDRYTEFKLALGSGLKSEGPQLKIFKERVGSFLVSEITPEQVEKFLYGSGPLTRTYYSRFAALNGLFKFAVARSYRAESPLPKVRPKIPSKFTPYIYSKEELQRLLSATTQKGVCGRIPPETFRTIILLIYGAVLRSGEATSLKVCDVDLKERMLIIHESKFYKTRVVPIGPNLSGILSNYFDSRLRNGEYFFLNKKNDPVSQDSLQEHFSRLRDAAGISRSDGYYPRLHDLRHTGAVHRVIDWYRKGKDVQKLVPRLSTYMGHTELKDTQIYLTLVPEIMGHASFKFEQYAFPEVGL